MGGRSVAHAFLATLLVALAIVAFVPSAVAQDAKRPTISSYRSDCSNVVVERGWGQIGLPDFGSGQRRVQSYTVDAWNKKRLFVTNGLEIFRSMDSGCSWHLVYELPAQPTPTTDYSALDSRIDQVVIPEGTTSDKFAYFVLDQYRAPDGVTRGMRTRVFRTESNGRRWSEADGEVPQSLPPHGRPELLLPSPSFPEVLYLLLESPDVQYTATSPDGGETWQTTGPVCAAPVTPTGVDTPLGQTVEDLPGPGCADPDGQTVDAPKPSDVAGIAIDPFHPNDLWYYGPRGLERSLNNGKSPEPIEDVDEPIGAVDIYRTAGQESRILAAGSRSPTLHISDDGGQTWRQDVVPGFVDSIAKGRLSTEYALATDSGVYLSVNGTEIALAPQGRVLTNLQSARALGGKGDLCFFGSSGSRIEASCIQPAPPPPCPFPNPIRCEKRDIDLDLRDLKKAKAASFSPENHVSELARGESEVVPYTLELFKSPTPLDVYFLIDISGSMQNTIDGVAHGMQRIVNDLTAGKINTEFGLGVYRSYDRRPAYKRVLDLAPPGRDLERALENLIATGGGNETQLAALYQSATGEGQQDVLPVAPLQANIPPGQEAHFRKEALKVVIHATDEQFSTLPPHPSFDEVITALNEHQIEQVGLAIQPPGKGGSASEPPQAQTTPRSGLLRVAEGTKTSAAGNVDCNGDEVPDIQPGDPLVCDIDPSRAYQSGLMSSAIVQLLESVEDIGEVLVTVDAPPGVVPNIESKLFTNIDFKRPQPLGFDVTFTCPIDSPQTEFEVRFKAAARDLLIAETKATVRCIVPEELEDPPPPKEVQRPRSPVAGFFPPVGFVPPLVRPPEVSPNPGPGTQTQPQAQQQAQLQNAIAKQKQEQVQLALAYSKGVKAELAAERAGDDLNMSKYRSTSSRRQEQAPPGLLLMLGASAMSLAFGLAARTKFKIQTQTARRTKRYKC